MDRDQHSRLPFLMAMFLALFGMPLEIYAFNQRGVGTAKIRPWQRRIGAGIQRLSSVVASVMAALRSPTVWRYGLAVVALILLIAHGHAHSGPLVLGLTSAADVRESINKLATDMQAMTNKARDDKRDLTADEEQKFDTMDADREKLIASEKRLLKIEELEGGDGRRAAPRQPGHEGRETRGGRQLQPGDRIEGIRAWLQACTEEPLTQAQHAVCQRLNINPMSKGIRLWRPQPILRSLNPTKFKEWEERALSTLVSTSPEDGSYLIPNDMMQPLERALLAFGGVRQAATVKRTNTGANYPIPTNDDTSNKGALLAENVIAVEKDPAFGQLVLNAFKFTSKKVLVSLELIQDSQENLAATLGDMLGERIGRIQNDYFTTGTGSSEPKGIVAAASNSNVQLAAQTPTYAELVGIQHSVDPAYRVNGGWMFADSMLAEIKKIVDASTGRPIWLPNMIQGEPDTILGDRYYVNQSMVAAAGSGAGKSILYGQLSKYIVRDVRDIVLFRLDELYAEYYQVAFVAFARADGDLLDAGTHPVKYALNKT